METKPERNPNEIISFAFGKTFAVFLLAIGLLAIAKNTGVVTVSGFLAMILSGYQSIIEILLHPLSWITVFGFEVTSVEKSAISLVFIILGGLSVWIHARTARWVFLALGAGITILIFGYAVKDLDTPDLILIALSVPLAPILLLYFAIRGLRFRAPFGLPVFWPVKSQLNDEDTTIEFRGLVTLTITDRGVTFDFVENLITLRMILEYLATVAAAMFIILALFAAGFIALI